MPGRRRRTRSGRAARPGGRRGADVGGQRRLAEPGDGFLGVASGLELHDAGAGVAGRGAADADTQAVVDGDVTAVAQTAPRSDQGSEAATTEALEEQHLGATTVIPA